MGTRLLLDKALAPALRSAGLSLEGLFRLGGDPEATSVVAVIDLPVDGTVGRFHVKRYRYPTWAQSKGLLGHGTLYGMAPEVQEFKNLEFLREKGVSAVRPVAAASITKGVRLVAHMLMTEDVPGAVDLQKRLDTPGDPVRDDRETRWRVAQLLGRQIYKMHAEGFAHRDLFPRNVLVRVDEDGPHVWVCDCRRGGPPSFRWKTLDDLATLDVDLRGRVSRTDRMRILRSYAGPEGRLSHFAADILKRRKRFEAKTA